MGYRNYYITTFPGIEPVAQEEIVTKWPSIKFNRASLTARNNSLLFFEYGGDVSDLLGIGTAEDLYCELASIKLSGTASDLTSIGDVLMNNQMLEPSLSLHRKLWERMRVKRTTFRVVAQASSDSPFYRRVDAQRVLENAISRRYHGKWSLVDDDAQLEFWLHLTHKKAIIGLRLSDKTMRHRTYKVDHLPASLRPTIAYALVWLSGIENDDVFLDPLCGAGTILIERAQAGRYKELLGGDIRPEAVQIAMNNIGNKYKPISVKVWDARKLPLNEASVNKVVTNLPFGRQIGSHEENKVLYHDFSKELARVLKPGGKAVLLTSESRLINETVLRLPNITLVKHYQRIQVLGYNADIFVINRV